MLELRNVTKRFGQTIAVDYASAIFPPGEMVAIIGSSGAGKSTLLRMINRLHDPSDGALLYCGQDILALRGKELRNWRQRCAMIFQQFNLVPRLDVITNVMLGRLNQQSPFASLFNYFSAADLTAALDCLARLGVVEQATQRASSLSGGQQQRVAIARALMQQPSILLADEPIASLDPLNSELVMQSLREINKGDGHTIICNLHSLEIARRFCDRIIGMRLGKIVFDGPVSDLTEEVASEIYQGSKEPASVVRHEQQYMPKSTPKRSELSTNG